MKKIVLTIATALLIGIAGATAQTTIKQDGNTFVEVVVKKKKESSYTPTASNYKDKKGETFIIHLHTPKRGKNAGKEMCYIKRVSEETGNPYWQEVDVDPTKVKRLDK